MKRYQYILLEWDGNLAKTLDLWLNALRIPLEARGYNLSDKQIGATFGEFKKRFEAHGIMDVDTIIAEANTISADRMPSVELYPDALEVLEALQNSGKQTALVTTSNHVYIDPLLKKHELERLFQVVVCGDDVTHHKPHAEPLLKAMAALNADLEQSIMIGDSDKDILGAKNAGIDSILFYPTSHERFFDIDELTSLQPTHIVGDFKEVLQIVN